MLTARTSEISIIHAINGRVATKDDVQSGAAIFYVPNQRSAPYFVGKPLPVWAVITRREQDGDLPNPGTRVQIVQAEQDSKDVLLGYVYQGKTGICSLQDVSIEDSIHTWNSLRTGTFAVFLLLICAAVVFLRIRRNRRLRSSGSQA